MFAPSRRRLVRPALSARRHVLVSSGQTVRHNSTILNGLGSCVAATAESLSAVHTAGLPWYIVLPLVATSLNFTIRLPAQWFGRYYRLRRAETRPLKSAWMANAIRVNMMKNQGKASLSPDLLRPMRETRRINKDFGVSAWKSWGAALGPMVPFVLVSEAVRRLADSPMTWLGRKLGLDRFLDLVEPGTSSLTDHSLSEGGLLWFTDLMAADPYGGLPLICALTLGWSSWTRLSADRLRELLSVDDRSMNSLQRARNALGRVLLVIPLFPLLFWNLPSAIFLYWAPTFLFNSINDTLLKRWLPDREPRYSIEGKKKPTKITLPYVNIEGYEVPKKQGSSIARSRQPDARS
ncbi:hypothetical protein NLU13_3452 [Sarocladium strictum]|uniref:Mitochondrial export translocase Oxa2 n=1 Tax=Sarocladium strictum TaxID=5046 RepID=A0AA39GMU9_SARSR|nr:hypothetical protein NLU13_3452 [Sarocladium strictum]